jgi:hypothetical protein
MTSSHPPFVKQRTAAILNLFTDVRWDTVIDERGEIDVLGWIDSTVVPEPRDSVLAGGGRERRVSRRGVLRRSRP